MKDRLLIIGAGGHGRVVANIALEMGKWEQIEFLDDRKTGSIFKNFKILGSTNDVIRYINSHDIFVGIGDNSIRQEFQDKLDKLGASIPTIIHPRSIIGKQVKIGKGAVVMGGVVINCCTDIGKGCIINTGATVDHDNNIQDYVHISPGANLGGNVKVGKKTWVGIGSTISNNVSVPGNTIIGAGATVIKSIKFDGIYAGVPAKRIKG